MDSVLREIKKCQLCKDYLPHSINPIVAAHSESKIAVVGQAPGKIVHNTGIPWNDKSGDRLRDWLQVDHDTFYNTKNFALIPMGFCFPGSGPSGDLPPRRECAPQWHNQLFSKIENLQLIILIGSYAHSYYLKHNKEMGVTQTVRNFSQYLPKYIALPHPSPRNNIWIKQNPWFGSQLLPVLRNTVKEILSTGVKNKRHIL